MFPVARGVTGIGILMTVAIGLVIGVLAGTLACTMLKRRIEGIGKDAMLGAVGFGSTLIGCPLIAAILIAAVLPVLHQFIRFKRVNSTTR
jgi:hypothetical protein